MIDTIYELLTVCSFMRSINFLLHITPQNIFFEVEYNFTFLFILKIYSARKQLATLIVGWFFIYLLSPTSPHLGGEQSTRKQLKRSYTKLKAAK